MTTLLDAWRPALHLVSHLLVPLAIAFVASRGDDGPTFRHALCWMLAAMVIDMDHLLADPIYSPGRCSIGFHPLHGTAAAFVYLVMVSFRELRWFGIGALVHLALDQIDCVLMTLSTPGAAP